MKPFGRRHFFVDNTAKPTYINLKNIVFGQCCFPQGYEIHSRTGLMQSLKWPVKSRSIFVHPILIFGLIPAFFFSLAILVSNHNSWDKTARASASLLDNIHKTTLAITQGHLWFEELLTNDKSVRMEDVWAHLDKADQTLEEVIKRGPAFGNPEDLSSDEKKLQYHLGQMKSSIKNLRDLTEKRLQRPAESGAGSKLDQQFDLLFQETLKEAEACNIVIHRIIESRLGSQHDKFHLLMGLWLITIFGGSLTLFFIEKKRRQAEKDLQKFKFMCDNSNDPHYIVDRDANIQYANRVAFEKLGYPDSELLRMKVPDVDMVFNLNKYQELFDRVQKGKEPLFESINKKKDGSTFISEFSVTGIKVNGNQYLFAVARDISDRKKAEEAILKAKKEAEEATKVKDKFVSLVAHDLQAPFSVILGFLNLLLNDAAKPLDPSHRMIIQGATDKAEELMKMTKDLLELSRLKSGKMIPKHRFLDGYYVASNAINQLTPPAKKKGISLHCEVPQNTWIYADPELFNRVIHNLIFNAVKFCCERDSVTVFFTGGEKSVIAVKDTGAGISEELQDKIFQYEENSSTRGTSGEKGTGFGLPLSRDIMEAHGGSLEFESQPGKGSVFYASLPYVRPLIMAVDDDPESRNFLRSALEVLNADVVEAINGKEALSRITECQPHLIVTDLRMPVMDGFEFVGKLRRGSTTKEVPVIVLTADNEEETRSKVFQCGANDYLSKPVAIEDLFARIKKYLVAL